MIRKQELQRFLEGEKEAKIKDVEEATQSQKEYRQFKLDEQFKEAKTRFELRQSVPVLHKFVKKSDIEDAVQ